MGNPISCACRSHRVWGHFVVLSVYNWYVRRNVVMRKKSRLCLKNLLQTCWKLFLSRKPYTVGKYHRKIFFDTQFRWQYNLLTAKKNCHWEKSMKEKMSSYGKVKLLVSSSTERNYQILERPRRGLSRVKLRNTLTGKKKCGKNREVHVAIYL